MTDNEKLILKMIEFDAGNPKQIQHFMKVYEFAHLIAVNEGLKEEDLHILDATAILHDIGIIPCMKAYGHCTGAMQEEEGPYHARKLLLEMGTYTDDEIERILFMIGHHHTYSAIEGIDFRILVEADFLVNAFEDAMDTETIEKVKEHIFRTPCGISILNQMFDLQN